MSANILSSRRDFLKGAFTAAAGLAFFLCKQEALALPNVFLEKDNSFFFGFSRIRMNGNNAKNLMKEWRDFSNTSYEVMLKSSLPKVKELIHFLDKEVSLKTDVEKVQLVDLWFNREVEYRIDLPMDRGKKVDYKSSFDIWKDIDELLENGGDCEDYVFGKYVALKYLGFDKQLSFVIGKKCLNGRYISHAILACDLGKNGKYLLDNTEEVTKNSEEYSASRVKPFRPLALFNTSREEFYKYFFV